MGKSTEWHTSLSRHEEDSTCHTIDCKCIYKLYRCSYIIWQALRGNSLRNCGCAQAMVCQVVCTLCRAVRVRADLCLSPFQVPMGDSHCYHDKSVFVPRLANWLAYSGFPLVLTYCRKKQNNNYLLFLSNDTTLNVLSHSSEVLRPRQWIDKCYLHKAQSTLGVNNQGQRSL